MDLSVNFAGLELKNPLVVASSDATRDIRQIRKAEACGAAAVIIKGALPPGSVGLESTLRIYADMKTGTLNGHAGARRLSFDQAIELVRQAKQESHIKIGANVGFWEADSVEVNPGFAKRAARAGADFIELHFSPQIPVHAAMIQTAEKRRGRADEPEAKRDASTWVSQGVAVIKQAVDIPVIAKLNTEGADIVAVSRAAEQAGADAVMPAGAPVGSIQIDIDNDGEIVLPGARTGCLHTLGAPWKPFAQGVVARVSGAVKIPVLGSGGLMDWKDTVEMLMFGAGAVSFCSLLLMQGFEAITAIEKGLRDYMSQHGYETIDDFRGLALKHIAPSIPACQIIPSVAAIDETKCSGCGRCLRLAACLAISIEDGKALVNEAECLGCGLCCLACPSKAVSLVEIGA